MDEPNSEDAAARPVATDVRFGMRAMLIVMAVVAVISAMVANVLRTLPAESQMQVAVYIGIVVAILVGSIFFVGWKRRRCEKSSGTPRFVLTPHSYLFPRAPRLAAIASGVGLLTIALSTVLFSIILIADKGFQSLGSMGYASFWAISACASGIGYLWWNRTVRFCETGVLERHKLVPWTGCRRSYWDACYRDVMVLEFQRNARVAVHVPNERRAAVENLLAEKVPKSKFGQVKNSALASKSAPA